MVSLIDVLKILAHDVGVVRAGMGGEDAEEVIGGDDLAATLREVILNERKEGFITNAGAEFFEEMRSLEISGVGVGTESLPVVDGDVHKTLRVVEVNSIGPPPVDKVGVEVFVIHAFRVCA